MKISSVIAQNIIDGLSNVLQQQLNFFDEDGMIIASTTPERINQFHQGAKKLIDEHLDELVVYENNEYMGARKGCNFPIVIDGITVGAIGITGEASEVRKYGQIIKRMTEMQILDHDAQEKQKIADRIRTRFFDDWVLNNQDESDPMFIERAKALNIDLSLKRRVVLMRIENLTYYGGDPWGQRVIDDINRFVRSIAASNSGCLFSKTASLMILLAPSMSDAQMRPFIQQVLDQVEVNFGVKLIAGVDSYEDSQRENIHHSYMRASDALHSCAYSSDKQILFYDEATFEFLIDELSDKSQNRFISKVFRGMGESEITESVGLLTTLYEMNGSITKTADAHFMHKNTLQYKLNKIYDKTGLNPRSMRSVALFYMATLFWKNHVPSNAIARGETPSKPNGRQKQ